MLRFLSLLFLLFVVSPSIIGQTYYFRHIGREEGLIGEKVNSLLQDRNGFIWVGTNNGLQRYDGKQFQTYQHKKLDKNSLSGDICLQLIEDKYGFIYVLTTNGISILNTYTRKFYSLYINDIPNNSRTNSVVALGKDGDGAVYAWTMHRIYKLNAESNRIELKVQIQPDSINYLIFRPHFDEKRDAFWFETYLGVTKYTVKTNELLYEDQGANEVPTFPEAEDNGHILFADSKDNLWYATYHWQVFRYNFKTGITKTYQINRKHGPEYLKKEISTVLTFIQEDSKRNLWFGTFDGGLLQYEASADTFIYHTNEIKRPGQPEYTECPITLIADREGGIWMGTDKGISLFHPYDVKFNSIYLSDKQAETAEYWNIMRMFQSSIGDIYISTYGQGVLIFDKNYLFKKQLLYNKKEPQKGLGHRFSQSYCVIEMPNNRVRIFSGHGSITDYDPITGEIKNYPQAELIGNGTIWSTCKLDSNHYLLGSSFGTLIIQDTRSGKLELVPETSLSSGTECLIRDHKGNIWGGTRTDGFYCFDPKSERIIKHYSSHEKGSQKIPIGLITSIRVWNDSLLVISSPENGLYLFNINTEKYRHYTIDDGLYSIEVYDVYPSSRLGEIWVSSAAGLFRYNYLTHKSDVFGLEDGIPDSRLKTTFLALQNRQILYGSKSGINTFDPSKFKETGVPSDVVFTSIQNRETNFSVDSIVNLGNKIVLGRNKNEIRFDFTSLTYQSGNRINYYYQLVGYDDTIIEAGSDRSVQYRNIAPGDYTFKVWCKNSDGVLSTKPTQLSIEVQPAFYEIIWIKLAFLLFIILGIWIVFKLRVKQTEKRQIANLAMIVDTQEEERGRIARDLHDDIGTQLSILQLYMSNLSGKNPDLMGKDLEKIRHDSEIILNEVVQGIRNLLMDLSPVTLQQFGYEKAILQLIGVINQSERIHFTYSSFGLENRLPIYLETALYRMTQELMNNIIKHAKSSEGEIQVGVRNGIIILMVEDYGIGFDTKGKKGNGLTNLQTRAQLFGGSLYIDSYPGKGTRVQIELPYNSFS